ncbi:MAG TPA: response regulator transcription factor [Candidatus Dormibacteraeota bacterium]|nr:response regulator transcription factor [Candidatus Dormibacteraeota bacterium]
MSIKIAIIEDDDWIRENLATQIRQTSGFSLAGTYQNGEEALVKITKAIPDVVLMDINLPRMSGIECVRKLRAIIPTTQVLMLTVYEDSDKIFDSLLAGASGYLLKRTPQSEILEAIRDVHAGNSPMTGHIARKVVQYFNQRGGAQKEIEKLSRREREVLDQLAQGIAYKEIADVLAVSIDTVRMHIKGIYGKLHVHSRGEAVAKYLSK